MTAESALHPVRLEIFEGPLDLLLHLVRIQAVEITDIPIAEITRQYQEYLDLLREWNLEIAAEFLLMAATLVHIKSRVLLPAPPGEGPEAGDEDPRAGLIRELLEHERLHEAVARLRDWEASQAGTSFRPDGVLAEFDGEFLLEADLFDLLSAFRRILAEERCRGEPRRLEPQRFPLREAIGWLLERLRGEGGVRLGDLFRDLASRNEKIAVFLALLELVRTGKARVAQREPGGEILLRPGTPPVPVRLASGTGREREETGG
ncbi:MAG: segregation/condensation protein A [Acidobacteria bacterium]|nr:segregation/condensation protein A [Acidobacteriota bacterium]